MDISNEVRLLRKPLAQGNLTIHNQIWHKNLGTSGNPKHHRHKASQVETANQGSQYSTGTMDRAFPLSASKFLPPPWPRMAKQSFSNRFNQWIAKITNPYNYKSPPLSNTNPQISGSNQLHMKTAKFWKEVQGLTWHGCSEINGHVLVVVVVMGIGWLWRNT